MKVQTENKDYVRDINSKALLAHDKDKADDYRYKSKLMNNNKNLTERINKLEALISEILKEKI